MLIRTSWAQKALQKNKYFWNPPHVSSDNMSQSNKKKSTVRATPYNMPSREWRKKRLDSMSSERPVLKEAKVVVGIDFGTTASGFAYASMTEPSEKPYTFYDWPSQPKPYCKTQTSLWYLPGNVDGVYKLENWGWPACVNYTKAIQRKNSPTKGVPPSSCGHFFINFKRHLAPSGAPTGFNSGLQMMRERLPTGLSVGVLISDYLKKLAAFVMEELEKRFGSDILKKDVQWCLGVPAIWTERAKQTMKDSAEMAGLVQGPLCRDITASLHELIIVLEPEAASVYCQQMLIDELHLGKGSKFLVVDAGGGTVDLVVHEKVGNLGSRRVKELTRSTGDFCGGTFVDEAFMAYLARKIDCFKKFSIEHPSIVLDAIKDKWENLKSSFGRGELGGQQDFFDLQVPGKLAVEWEANQKRNGSWREDSRYFEVTITNEDMRKIFDGQVDIILKLVEDQLVQVPDVEAIMVVGGFSNSPYLMKRIKDKFSSPVRQVLSPVDPGSAVCKGAVAFGLLGPDLMMSRKSRKTYGVVALRRFRRGDPQNLKIYDHGNRVALCDDWFYVFTRIGDDVPVDHKVSKEFYPVDKTATQIQFTMYSTTDPRPRYITDAGVSEEGSWAYPLPAEAQKMKDKPEVEVSMYFGRAHIEVFAEPKNFVGEKRSMLNVSFEGDYLV